MAENINAIIAMFGSFGDRTRQEMHQPGQLWASILTIPKYRDNTGTTGDEIVEHIRPLLAFYNLKLRVFQSLPMLTLIWRDTKIGKVDKLGSLTLDEIKAVAACLQTLPTMAVQSIREERTMDEWGRNLLEAEWRVVGNSLVRFHSSPKDHE